MKLQQFMSTLESIKSNYVVQSKVKRYQDFINWESKLNLNKQIILFI